ncbi:hypothetical protein [Mesorhizobium sp.]|uniref:hypothetical protein n=1 Tax=Mesorhizobium sp. TaxID=1871066 RepID=UPI000FE2C69B|nr:hypothetical protein [Mesorhizobium sp.]RWN99003.1 MAG: hypothetical protein EOS06_20605 [Mesorhizobium sp.]
MTSERANAFSKKIMVQQRDSGGGNRSAAILAGRVKRFGEGPTLRPGSGLAASGFRLRLQASACASIAVNDFLQQASNRIRLLQELGALRKKYLAT